ncbi:hypothetical protein OOZ63_19370 [Paucibacter sp. PLA-PC-4]|uniref:hypothetical protein n=1 Tax=Paucibacter sp. PLA-PC-4 TaxID=2993655 RepID=UPI00224B1D0A|nr:hypothetical protein [Paucibacter sp. PLA-PC-4]MCX2863992.1 hypothetical protein [Paucibacter sp. PLA-PC-4]
MLGRACELGAQVHHQQQTRRKKKSKSLALIARQPLVAGVKAKEPTLRKIAADGEAIGLGPAVSHHLRPHILARADELAAIA